MAVCVILLISILVFRIGLYSKLLTVQVKSNRFQTNNTAQEVYLRNRKNVFMLQIFFSSNEITGRHLKKKVRDHQDSGQIQNLGSHHHEGDHPRHHRHPPDLIQKQQSQSVLTERSDVVVAPDEELAEV